MPCPASGGRSSCSTRARWACRRTRRRRSLRRMHDAATIAEAVAGVDYVQESVREDVTVKREVFAEIAAAAPAERHSGVVDLGDSRQSEFLGHICPIPERALVVHPVNPPSLIPLVELCGTPWTTPETMQARPRDHAGRRHAADRAEQGDRRLHPQPPAIHARRRGAASGRRRLLQRRRISMRC